MKKTLFVLMMLATLTGCLEKEVTQTLYLEVDDSVTWEVLERNVYSSANSAEEREREEREYLKRALSGRPDVLDGLAEIGGIDLWSEVLRDRAPYSVRATAHFRDLEAALSGLFKAAEIDAQVQLVVDGTRRILTLTPTDFEPEVEEDSPTLHLLVSDDLRFVLSAGEFEECEGFEIEAGGRVAVWSGGTSGEEETPRRFRLVWRMPEPRG